MPIHYFSPKKKILSMDGFQGKGFTKAPQVKRPKFALESKISRKLDTAAEGKLVSGTRPFFQILLAGTKWKGQNRLKSLREVKTAKMRFLEAGSPDNAQVVILGAPFEEASSYRKGSALAPTAIRRASQSIESYSAIFRADLRDIALGDAGDLVLSTQPDEALTQIASAVEEFLLTGRRVVVLGGDHSVTIGVITGIRRVLPQLQVAVLDAHSDWRDSYNGSRYSHACTIRRIWEMVEGRVWVAGTRSFVGNEDWSRYVSIEELPGKLDPSRPTYLSIDIDAIDPSLCPGVGNPEPGGLKYEQVISLFQAMRNFTVVGMDIVEVHPPYDPAEVTAVTAAKLIQEGILAFWGK